MAIGRLGFEREAVSGVGVQSTRICPRMYRGIIRGFGGKSWRGRIRSGIGL